MKLSLIACCIAAAACVQGMLVGATGVDSLGSPELFEASECMAPTDNIAAVYVQRHSITCCLIS
jgi:hypothetical protein